MRSGEQTTPSLIARLAAEAPDRIVLSDEHGRTLSALGLWRGVQALARSLQRLGVRRGDRIAIRAANCIEWSLWEYAAQTLAAVPVGIGVQWNDQQASEVLADCGASVLVAGNPASLSGIAPEQLESFRLVCVIEPPDVASPPAKNCVAHAELMSRCSGEAFAAQSSDSDAATIIYTSGSTGKPKGIVHTHARVMAAVHAIAGFFPELAGGERALSSMPMEHLFQRILNLVSLSFAMDTRILADPRKQIAALRELRPCYFAGVPFVYEQLLQAIDAAPDSFAACRRELRLMIVGSAPSSPDLLNRFTAMGFPVRQAYSTSECLVPIAANTLTENRLGSVGKPHTGYAFRLSDEGEICVKGPGVFQGYWGREDEAPRLFDADGYFKTGDFGHLDGDGYLFVSGRREDFFKTSTGRKVSPIEVESAYKRSPLVEHIIVVGDGRKHPAAIIQLNDERAAALARQLGLAAANAEELSHDERMKAAVLAELRRHDSGLDSYKRVRGIVLLARALCVESGELTPTLKLRRELIVRRCEPLLKGLEEHDDSGTGGKHAA